MDTKVYVDNAGLVLAAAFLPALFGKLDMTESSGGASHWKSADAAARATHLLQFLVNGQASAPEPTLILNKVLCGLGAEAPVGAGIEITDREKDEGENLLRAMIANWRPIEQSSIDALRETFLHRDGRLEPHYRGLKLVVQRRTVDVLVDQIPWSISVIQFPWMPLPLYVTW